MIGRRYRNWFPRTALVAMAALLCSQLALAGHGECLDVAEPSTAIAAAVADVRHGHGHGCDAGLPPANRPLCDAHCTEGKVSADSGRTPSVPPLLAGAWLPWFAMSRVAKAAPAATPSWVDSPPRPVRHRPTDHPAALLLI